MVHAGAVIPKFTNYNASRMFYEFAVFPSHTLSLSLSFSRPLLSTVLFFLRSTMVNWESPVTIANELCALISSVPLVCVFLFTLIFCHLQPPSSSSYMSSTAFICASLLSFRTVSLPPRNAYNHPVTDGSSFATLASSGA